jgi:hypothetical protein
VDVALSLFRALDVSSLPQFVLGTAASLWPYVIILVGVAGLALLGESLKSRSVDAVDLAVAMVLLGIAFWRGSLEVRIVLSLFGLLAFTGRRPVSLEFPVFVETSSPAWLEWLEEGIDFARDIAMAYIQMFATVTLVGVPLVAALSSTPWVPAERITSASFSGPVYVIGSSDDWTTILGYRDHQIRLIRTSSITARSICEPQRRGVVFFDGNQNTYIRTLTNREPIRNDLC